MARLRPQGTSAHTKAKGFLFPPDNRLWLGIGAVVGAAIVLGAVGLFVIGSMNPSLAGARAALSPGDVASHHARIDLKCGQCHQTAGGVQSVRCERCHDPSGTDRLLHSAHVLLGSGDRGLADRAEVLECASCHTDHRGRDDTPRTVDDRECATCHQFRSFGGHPEFSVVRARATPGVGLEFDHDRHVVEAAKARVDTCQSCHEQTPDRRAFQPMTFDRHCASCHLKDGLISGETDFVQPDLLVLPEEMPSDRLGGSRPQIQTNPRGRRKASGLRHRDAWVLYNAARLRRGVDREGDDAERALLAARIRYLEQLEQAPATRLVPPNEVGAAIDLVRAELADIDRVDGSATTDEAALRELSASAQAIASSLRSATEFPALDFSASNRALGMSAQPETGRASAAQVEQRKTELLRVLDVIVQRLPDSPVAARATALRAEVERLAASGEAPVDRAGLLDRLDRLDEALSPLRALADPGSRSEVGGIDAMIQLARERAGAGLGREEFEIRRRELIALLDAIEARGGDSVRARVGLLRGRALSSRPGVLGSESDNRTRRQRQRVLDRLLVEQELDSSPADRDDTPSQDASLDRGELDRSLRALQARLTELEQSPRMPGPGGEAERGARAAALESLLVPCLKCHELNSSRSALASVRIAEPVMRRSLFTHAPHTIQASCESCHGTVRASKAAADVNVPGVSTCQACHRSSLVKATCSTCHVYHPSSAVRLAVTAR